MTDLDPRDSAREDRAPGHAGGRGAPRRDRDGDLWSGLVGGLAILAVGLVFWLDHLGRIEAGDYLRWWPLILIAYGLAHFPRRRWLGAAILILIGLAFLPPIDFLGHLRLGVILSLTPLLVSAAGVTLIAQALRPASKDLAGSGAFLAVSFMGGSFRTIDAPELAGGDAIAVMGGCEVRINSSGTAHDAVIDVMAFWGGIQIRVPRGWRIESHVTPILGGYSDRTAPASAADAPRLTIRGSAIMAGVEVLNPREDAA